MERVLGVVVVLMAAEAHAEEPWRLLRTEPDGLRVETREVPGTRFPEFRVTARTATPPATLADVVWTWNAHGVEAELVERREVLRESRSERVVWSLLRPPLVSRRESLIRWTRATDGDAVSIHFQSEPGAGPETPTDAVRVALVRGEWRLTRDAGGTTVQHRLVSDPGGGVAPWMARATQEQLVVSLVREVLQRAR